jgi:hypothetical protein
MTAYSCLTRFVALVIFQLRVVFQGLFYRFAGV